MVRRAGQAHLEGRETCHERLLRGGVLLAFRLGLLAFLHQFLLAPLEAFAHFLKLAVENGRVGRLLLKPLHFGIAFAQLGGEVAYLAVAFRGGLLLEKTQRLQFLAHVRGAGILGMRQQGAARHVLGVGADALENLLAAGDQTFAAGLVDGAQLVELARLVLDAGCNVVRLVLHQRVDRGLGVRRKARRGRQALEFVGELLDAVLVLRLVGL